jgi:hypothetical protein
MEVVLHLLTFFVVGGGLIGSVSYAIVVDGKATKVESPEKLRCLE